METLRAVTDEEQRTPKPSIKPIVIMMSGLPGTGKTFFSRRLAEKLPLIIIESDRIRKTLFPKPAYTPAENTKVFQFVNQRIEELLKDGVSVIFDATNLEERHRRSVYRIAEKWGVRLLIIKAEAPVGLVRKRLNKRISKPDTMNLSDADWYVYRRMKSSAEKITLPHFTINTAGDITPAIEKIIQEINRRKET